MSSTVLWAGCWKIRNDGLTTSRFVVCEMETLLSGSYGEATVMAVLLYCSVEWNVPWMAALRWSRLMRHGSS